MIKWFAGYIALAVLGFAWSAGTLAAEAESPDAVELKLDLPRPMFVGTPKNLDAPNLESPDTPRKPVMVPKGVENVALDKPVTSSDDFPIIGELAYVPDGEKSGEDGSFVELGPFLQWVQIDLKQPCEIHAIALWHYHAQARVYRDVIIQLSDDPDFVTGVKTVFNNDHDNSAGLGVGKDKEYIETYQGRKIPVDGLKARYVRLYSNGYTTSDTNHYVEVEVYGKEPA